MSENLLSQEEIDALFAKRKEERERRKKGGADPSASDRTVVGPGFVLPKGVVLYDFRNPNRLSKDEIQRLRVVHQSFLRSANMSLSLLLETPVEGALTAMDQLTYRDFLASLPPVTCIGTCKFEGHDGEFLIEISHTLLFPLLNRMLGGLGGASDNPNRELTDIEIAIARHLFERYLEVLGRAWSPGDDESLEMQLLSIETSPRFASAASEGQSVLAAVCQIRVGGEEGSLAICYPHTLIEPLIEQLDLGHGQRSSRARRSEIAYSLAGVPVSLSAILGSAEVDLTQLADLREGDVIRLDQEVTAPIQIFTDSVLVAEARPGTKNERRAFQVVKVSGAREALRE